LRRVPDPRNRPCTLSRPLTFFPEALSVVEVRMQVSNGL
jgi:hypothetical protein